MHADTLQSPTLQNIRAVEEELEKQEQRWPFVVEAIGRCARLRAEATKARRHFLEASEHWQQVIERNVRDFGAPDPDSLYKKAITRLLAGADDAANCLKVAALGPFQEELARQRIVPYLRRDAAYWAIRLGANDPRLEEVLSTPHPDAAIGAAVALSDGDRSAADEWLAEVEDALFRCGHGPHQPDASFTFSRQWDWWEEIKQLIAQHEGRPPLTMEEMRLEMVALYERGEARKKAKRSKRKEWKVDFTKPLEFRVRPPIEDAAEACVTVWTGLGPAVYFHLDTSGEAWQEMGYLKIVDMEDGTYESVFVDRVYDDEIGEDVEQEWIIPGSTLNSFDDAIAHVVAIMENGDEREQRMAKTIEFLADELTRRSSK